MYSRNYSKGQTIDKGALGEVFRKLDSSSAHHRRTKSIPKVMFTNHMFSDLQSVPAINYFDRLHQEKKQKTVSNCKQLFPGKARIFTSSTNLRSDSRGRKKAETTEVHVLNLIGQTRKLTRNSRNRRNKTMDFSPNLLFNELKKKSNFPCDEMSTMEGTGQGHQREHSEGLYKISQYLKDSKFPNTGRIYTDTSTKASTTQRSMQLKAVCSPIVDINHEKEEIEKGEGEISEEETFPIDMGSKIHSLDLTKQIQSMFNQSSNGEHIHKVYSSLGNHSSDHNTRNLKLNSLKEVISSKSMKALGNYTENLDRVQEYKHSLETQIVVLSNQLREETSSKSTKHQKAQRTIKLYQKQKTSRAKLKGELISQKLETKGVLSDIRSMEEEISIMGGEIENNHILRDGQLHKTQKLLEIIGNLKRGLMQQLTNRDMLSHKIRIQKNRIKKLEAEQEHIIYQFEDVKYKMESGIENSLIAPCKLLQMKEDLQMIKPLKQITYVIHKE